MGQPVAVVQKPSSRPGIMRFEANRSLTGMGHERYRSVEDAFGAMPSAVLARRLLETGKVDAVHVYLNIVTVDVKKGHDVDGLADIVENLYVYYTPGFVLPKLEEPVADVEPAPAPAPSGGATAVVSEAAKKIPAHLLERSRAAKAKAAAKAAG